jgi:membrane protease YdiL (CAAX protease family)
MDAPATEPPPEARVSALIAPAAVPAAMRAAFPAAAWCLGRHRGYLAGFGLYWAVCFGAPLAVLGPRRILGLFQRPAPLTPNTRRITGVLLLVPPLGGLATQFVPEVRRADPPLLAAALTISFVNAAAEELLWRGLPLANFPSDPVRGWFWPGAGFGAWHLAPLAVLPSRHDNARFVGISALLGLGLGWVARRTHSLRPTLLSHIATDAMGLRAYRF